jgi:hypothetical protein
MRILHNLLIGASGVLLDVFAGDPIAPVTITVPNGDAIASDFGRVSADLRKAIDKVENADQLELAFP